MASFFTTDRDPENTQRATPRVARPVAYPITDAVECMAEYSRLSDKIGFAPGSMYDERLKAFLQHQEIPRFSYADVDVYLRAKARADLGDAVRWCWRPLRERDRTLDWALMGSEGHGAYRGKDWSGRPYGKIIPMRVLERIALVQEEFPDAIFFVSDYEMSKPDPFLAVCGPMADTHLFIIDVWDEPGFTDTPHYE